MTARTIALHVIALERQRDELREQIDQLATSGGDAAAAAYRRGYLAGYRARERGAAEAPVAPAGGRQRAARRAA